MAQLGRLHDWPRPLQSATLCLQAEELVPWGPPESCSTPPPPRTFESLPTHTLSTKNRMSVFGVVKGCAAGWNRKGPSEDRTRETSRWEMHEFQ